MNVMFLQDYKDDYRQYNNSQYGEVPDFVGYRLIREKIAVRAGFLLFKDPKRENYGNDLVSINEAVRRISNGCFLPNPDVMLRLYAHTTINDYDWVGYTEYDFGFIEDIIQALPTDKQMLFWDCVYNQYCRCTTADYEQHGREKQDFEERLRLNKPTEPPQDNTPETSSETEPPETSSKQEKLTFIDILRKTPSLEKIIEEAQKQGLLRYNPNGQSYWNNDIYSLNCFANYLKDVFKITKKRTFEAFINIKTGKAFSNPQREHEFWNENEKQLFIVKLNAIFKSVFTDFNPKFPEKTKIY